MAISAYWRNTHRVSMRWIASNWFVLTSIRVALARIKYLLWPDPFIDLISSRSAHPEAPPLIAQSRLDNLKSGDWGPSAFSGDISSVDNHVAEHSLHKSTIVLPSEHRKKPILPYATNRTFLFTASNHRLKVHIPIGLNSMSVGHDEWKNRPTWKH